jgi:hypothetical protein
VGIGLGIVVFVGITIGGIEVAGIEGTAGAALLAGVQAVTRMNAASIPKRNTRFVNILTSFK